MTEFFSNSYEETLAYAASLAAQLKKGSVIAFLGDLGAGKTAFTAGFVKGLGIDAEVSSPTFAICNVYRGKNDTVYHYDMYRIENWDDLETTGYFDSLATGAYILCEWAENIYGALPEDALIITITKLGENERRFRICTKKEYDENDIGN